jgi:integrase
VLEHAPNDPLTCDNAHMASVSKTAAGYVVRWRVDGNSRQRTFKAHRDAVDHKTAVEAEAAAGKAVDPVKGRSTFADWYPLYVASRVNVKPVTLATSKSLYDNHVNRWDAWQLDRIRQTDVQAWIAELVAKGTPSASTIHAVYKEFASAMRGAVAARYVRDTPCVGVNLPSIDRDPMTVLDHKEIGLLADTINERYKALVLFLAYSGLRIGEAAALTWDDIDLGARTVTVRNTVTELAGQGLILTRPKTKAARRTVPLPKHVTEALKTHRQRFSGTFVFTTGTGAQLNPRAFNRRSFSTALKTTKLDCRVHDLRHTAISLWIRAGVDLPRVKAWAGHTDAAFTLNTYAKFFPTDDAGVMAMLDAGIAKGLNDDE